MAGDEVGAENQIEIAARTAAGSLRWELERYVTGVLATNDDIKARFNVLWTDVEVVVNYCFTSLFGTNGLLSDIVIR